MINHLFFLHRSQIIRHHITEIELPRIVPEEPEVAVEELSSDGTNTTIATQTDLDGACPTCGYDWATNVLVEKGTTDIY